MLRKARIPMNRNRIFFLIACAGSCLIALPAHAGMPMFTLTDIARFRLSAISLFVFIYLLASFAVFKLWNLLQKDFQRLPELSFKQALALVFLWGLALHLLLVVISGTRELMTPKALEKAGIVRHLAPDSFQQLLDFRQHKIDVLRKELWRFAKAHDGRFPDENDRSDIPDEVWMAPAGKLPYRYVAGLKMSTKISPLAYEPETYGEERMVLFTNGMIELLPATTIDTLVAERE